jgi:hypothetical protein
MGQATVRGWASHSMRLYATDSWKSAWDIGRMPAAVQQVRYVMNEFVRVVSMPNQYTWCHHFLVGMAVG